MAEAWLEAERDYCLRCERGAEEYRRPSEREGARKVSTITLGEWATLWLEHHRKEDGTELRANSMRALKASVRNFVYTLGPDVPLASITTQDVEGMNALLAREKGAYAANSAYKKLKTCLGDAARVEPWHQKLIESNPCTVPAPKRPRRSAQARIPEPTPQELRAIYDNMPEYLRIGVYFCATCGGDRINELCALRVSDIDLERRMVHIHRGLTRGDGDRGPLRVVEQTKNEASEAYVPIPDAIVPMLREHIREHTDWPEDPNAMLLKPALGGEAVPPGTFRDNFKKAAAKAGRPDLHVHSLRAMFDTYAVRLNVDGTMRDYMTVARRTDEVTAVNAYQKSDMQRCVGLVNRIGDAIIASDTESDTRPGFCAVS